MKLHPEINLYYQGTNEKYFLDKMLSFNMTENLRRGSFIQYYYNTTRSYHPDYQININNIFEIKCKYTYDYNNKNLELRKKNNLKFKSTIQKGYNLILVFDKVKLLKVDFDFTDDYDLHNDHRCIEFTKENLLKLMEQQNVL